METNQILVDIHSSTRPIQSGQNLHNLHKFIMYFIHRKISSIKLDSTDINDLGLEPLSHIDPYYQRKRNVEYRIEYPPYSRGDIIPPPIIQSKSGQRVQYHDNDELDTLKYFIYGFKIITGLRIASFTYGILLSLFILKLINVKPKTYDLIIASLLGVFSVFVMQYQGISWTWFILVSSTITISSSILLTPIFTNET